MSAEHRPIREAGEGKHGRAEAPSGADVGNDRGSGTVLAVGVVLGLVSVLLLALGLVAVLIAGQQARSAADLAALAAAGEVVSGSGEGSACSAAARVAQENGADLERCTTEVRRSEPWPRVSLTVSRAVTGTPWRASARAAAGGVSAPPAEAPER